MLARTDLQHIAGTRCPLDFVEVPSNFLELFARCPKVLSTFARHYRTGEPLADLDLLRRHRLASISLQSLETQNQLQMALLDQAYHAGLNRFSSFSSSDTTSTSTFSASNLDSTAILRDIQNKYNVIPFVEGTAWQVQFSHLFSYGASYYSYFWARRWGNRIFRLLFAASAMNSQTKSQLSVTQPHLHPPDSSLIVHLGVTTTTIPMRDWRASGELVRRELLGWGGGRDPWIGLENIGVVRDGDRDGRTKGSLDDLIV